MDNVWTLVFVAWIVPAVASFVTIRVTDLVCDARNRRAGHSIQVPDGEYSILAVLTVLWPVWLIYFIGTLMREQRGSRNDDIDPGE